MRKYTFYIILLICSLVVSSCSVSKFIPEDDYLLDNVNVKSVDRTVDVSMLNAYIRQHPNSKWFSLLKVPMAPYLLSGTDTTKRINRFLQKVGEAPVIYDTVQAEKAREAMCNAMSNKGFLDSEVRLEKKVRKKKVNISYIVNPGKLYYIRNIYYRIDDNDINDLIIADTINSQLSSGVPFNLETLDSERNRLTMMLQNSGYYKFNKEFITFVADTCIGDYKVDLVLHVSKYQKNVNSVPENHRKYKIGNIAFINNSNSYENIIDTVNMKKIVYRDCPIYYKDKLFLRPSVFLENNRIFKDSIFRERNIQRTYSNFAQLPAVRFTNISLHTVDTTSNVLDCHIYVNENKPHSFGADVEGTNSAGDLGAALALSYQNRNMFRGSELFSLKFRGAFEAITGLEGYSDQNYMEFSVEAGLTFPNFNFFRLNSRKLNMLRPTSEVSLMYDSQNRPEFYRRVLTSALRYRWSSLNSKFRHRVDLVDLNYVFMPWISETFKKDYLDDESNRNAILKYNYENLFIMKLGYSFTYNSHGGSSMSSNYGTNALGIRFNIESAGNILYAGSNLFNTQRNSDNKYTLFNIAYAQYVKTDLDLSKSIRFDTRNSLALHFGIGVAYPYGNSNVLPYEKRYFSGGANSVRGWSVRELGPGRFTGGDGRIDFINQTGDIKLDINAEYRTFLFWKLHGAFFVDAGNIWTIRNYDEQPGGQFRLSTFWKEIAVSYGLGLRLNFDFFILRLDAGVKAVNPAYTDLKRHFPIAYPNLKRDLTLHFAVGLPF